MFFFGSISTFLPYLLYISVVWICVLIGIRGQFFSNFLSSDKAENKVVVESNEKNTEENCYILNYQDNEDRISQNKSICKKCHSNLLKPEIIALKYQVRSDRIYQPIKISGNSLRGPPYLSV